MDRTVFITGANRGIGLEFSKQYAEEGWQVLATCRHPERAKDLNQLAAKYPKVNIYKLDVLQSKDIQQLGKTISGKPIDIVLNNAGIFGIDREAWEENDRLDTIDEQTSIEIFRTNAIAPLHIAKALLPNIEQSSLKMLVNISSEAGSIAHAGYIGNVAYHMSKAALNMAMKCLDQEWRPEGIRILLLCPGWVKTDMGGQRAPLEKEFSVRKLRALILNKMKDREGLYFNYRGDPISW